VEEKGEVLSNIKYSVVGFQGEPWCHLVESSKETACGLPLNVKGAHQKQWTLEEINKWVRCCRCRKKDLQYLKNLDRNFVAMGQVD